MAICPPAGIARNVSLCFRYPYRCCSSTRAVLFIQVIPWCPSWRVCSTFSFRFSGITTRFLNMRRSPTMLRSSFLDARLCSSFSFSSFGHWPDAVYFRESKGGTLLRFASDDVRCDWHAFDISEDICFNSCYHFIFCLKRLLFFAYESAESVCFSEFLRVLLLYLEVVIQQY